MSTSATPEPVIRQIVEAMRALAGPHPGFRPVHAKGIVCSGTFRASAEARAVSRALHLQGQAVPTVMRFSNSSGDPNVHDGIANARALAVKFQLPYGKNADILALHIEGFPARTSDEFLAFLRAQLPDPATGKPAPNAVPRFLDSHPTTRAFIERLMQKPVPASGLGGPAIMQGRPLNSLVRMAPAESGRYRWMPEAGEAHLPPDDASKRSANFLREELESRLRDGSGRVPPPLAIGWRRSDGRRHRLVAGGPALGRAGAAGGDRHLSDERGRRASHGVRPPPT